MEWYEWVPEASAAVVSIGALVYAAIADRRARAADRLASRAEERAERVERLERIRFEVLRAPSDDTVFGLINRGTEPAEGVEIDAESLLSVAFSGKRYSPELKPSERMVFALGESGSKPNLPPTIRVTWAHPFRGEQHVPLPDDPDAPWSYAIWS